MPTKITPTLYIGLGGTGARALLRAKQCFMDAYKGKVPSMVEFLAIDTDSNIGGSPIKSSLYGDISLDKNETLYITEKNARGKYHEYPEDFTWVPAINADKLGNIRGSGAGMVRSNGRFILQENENAVKTAIRGKIGNITRAIALGGQFVPSVKDGGQMQPAIVNIVGSIAGGTGCGMMVDMLQMADSALKGYGHPYYIYPWIIMPDIYRFLYPRMSDAVFLNAFGALREIDYLFNLKGANRNPITIGNERITQLSESISYAYIVNNYNTYAGTIDSDVDIADSVGRSMFMPTNDMGTAVETPMDNIRNWKDNFNMFAEGKSCWCASTGSAEIVYDSQIVGDCIGYSLIRSVANQLVQISDANTIGQMVQQWMSSPEVSIQERNADLLIDSLLDARFPSNMAFDKESTVSDIENFINIGTNVKDILIKRYSEITLHVSSELGKKVNSILNSAHGIGDALEFLSQLLQAISLCESDMHREIDEHEQRVNAHQSWDNALKGIFKTTIFGGRKVDEDAAEALSQMVSLHISDLRNKERKQYALNVYAALRETINGKQTELVAFKNKMKGLSSLMTNWIEVNKNEASKDSKFRINLYKDALNVGRKSNLDDSFNYASQSKITDLLSAVNEKALFDIMKPWADGQQEVQSAFSKSIDDVLSAMPEDEVKEKLQYVKKMSSPMWNVDFGGKLRSPKDLINMFIVGCSDANNNILRKTKEYSDIFESTDGSVRPYYTAIGSTSRIQILTLSCCAPVYAVGNTLTYEKEYNKLCDVQAGYLDQQWNLRMLSEKFSIIPVKKASGPDPLEIWVKSIVLGLIQYDTSNEQYWVESEKGVARKGYRFDLGSFREVAYNAFKSLDIFKECKEVIDNKISSQGKENVQAIFDRVDHKNYYQEYSIMSEKDKVHIDEDAYKGLQDLVDDEIAFIKEGRLRV